MNYPAAVLFALGKWQISLAPDIRLIRQLDIFDTRTKPPST